MKKDVLVRISGLQSEISGDESEENAPLEVVTPASYFLKNGKHYVLFDEFVEGTPGVTKNKIKISGNDCVEIIKTGITNAHMVFERKKKNVTYYQTPFGQILVGLNTRDMDVKVTDRNIDVRVDYEMDVNYEPLADCTVKVNIIPRDREGFALIK